MSLEKLKIEYEQRRKDSFSGVIEALFNPGQLSYLSSATWERVDRALASKNESGGTTVFRGVAPETLTVNLFFDTYAPYASSAAGGLLGLIGGSAPAAESVAKYTDQVMQLARIDKDMHRPPVCKLSWGKGALFRGVLQRTTRSYVLFLEDGTPVRATMECTFLEVSADAAAPGELRSADVAKKYIVRPGDTLMGIAAAHYGDGALWRRIADENRIEDPRRLVPGRALAIPRIR